MTLITPDWPAPAHVVAFSTTRESGDLARPGVLEGFPAPRVKQVHGKRVVVADGLEDGTEADAVFTRQPEIVCRVETADCLPVLLSNRAGTEVAAVHAGWRGLVAGILEAALASMASPPGDVVAWIGPAISQACYEVGGELREAFLEGADKGQRAAVDACFLPRGAKYLADLPALARLRLEARGVLGVSGGGLCTYTDARRFHSWRRDGQAAGRIVSGIAMLPVGAQSHT